MEEIKDTPPTQDTNTSESKDTTMALVGHLGGLFSFLVPLIIYLVKKDDADAWTLAHLKEAANFHITITIAVIVSLMLAVVLIGFILLPIVALGGLILAIIAAMKASKGEDYRYPVAIRFIK